MAGVGAALTDSSAWLIANRLTPNARNSLMADLFGAGGAALSYLRVPLSSSDFATSDYSYDDLPFPSTDPDLTRFSVSREDVATVPLLQQAKSLNPELKLMGSPWSAPGWMKSGNNPYFRKGLIGGTLRSDSVAVYARYLRRVTQEFASRGLALDTLTMQNEPAYAPADYAGMLLSPEQEAALAKAVSQELATIGSPTKVLVHDHNWNIADRVDRVLSDPNAVSHVDGVAFHCYGGDPGNQDLVTQRHPGTPIYFTECTGTFSSGTFASNLLWNTNQLSIGAVRHGARTVLLWNLALDPSGGPRVGGCPDCRGVVTIRPDTGEVVLNEEYYALAHLARAAPPGSHRVESTDQAGPVRNVAFLHEDGTRGLVLSNDGGSPASVRVRDGADQFSYTVPGRSVATLRWRNSQP